MDFNTYLKQELGFQPGQVIPPNKVAGFKEKYNRYLKSQQEESRKTAERQQQEQANAARIEGASALFGAKVEEAQQQGRTLNPKLVESAFKLIGAGQIEQADKVSAALFAEESVNEEQRLKVEEAKSKQQTESKQSMEVAEKAAEGIRLTNDLSNSPGFSGVFGVGLGTRFLPGTDARDADATRKRLVALASTDAIKAFQGYGAMSNIEFKTAQEAATSLADTGISEEKAASEINKLRSYFGKAIRNAEEFGKIPKGASESLISQAMQNLKVDKDKDKEQPKTAAQRLKEKTQGR
jgi:hypothetical protein